MIFFSVERGQSADCISCYRQDEGVERYMFKSSLNPAEESRLMHMPIAVSSNPKFAFPKALSVFLDEKYDMGSKGEK